jgi:hypothetical protein
MHRNHVRSLWVGAEEEGLLGSNYYVSQLGAADRSKIIAMLDFDMVASPNYARQVYDDDGSTFGFNVSGPNGSALIEGPFSRWFDSQSEAHEPIPVRRLLGLRCVHQRRHPGGRRLHGRRKDQNAPGVPDVRRHGGSSAGPVPPPGLRQDHPASTPRHSAR